MKNSPDTMTGLTLALRFDDVLLSPAASSTVPKDANNAIRLTGEITLGIPLMSVAIGFQG